MAGTRSGGTSQPDLLLRPAPRSLGAVAIPHLVAAHSTAPPELTIVLLGGALVVAVLRFRSRRGGGRGPFGGGGPFGGRGGPFGGGSGGGYGRTGRGGSTGESNPPSDL
jgi:hypothetical protein